MQQRHTHNAGHPAAAAAGPGLPGQQRQVAAGPALLTSLMARIWPLAFFTLRSLRRKYLRGGRRHRRRARDVRYTLLCGFHHAADGLLLQGLQARAAPEQPALHSCTPMSLGCLLRPTGAALLLLSITATTSWRVSCAVPMPIVCCLRPAADSPLRRRMPPSPCCRALGCEHQSIMQHPPVLPRAHQNLDLARTASVAHSFMR